MERERSQAVWLKGGDKNTKFFHGKDGQRKKINMILKLKNSNGARKRGDDNCEKILISYFSDLFAYSHPTNISSLCEVVKGKLSETHKTWCSEQGVKVALDQMHPLKAPRPDGLPALFYQKYWHVVGTEVMQMVINVLNNNHDPTEMNKCPNP